MQNIFLFCLANDVETEGVYVHASDENRFVTWFSPKWRCGSTYNNYYFFGGDAFLLGLHSTRVENNGAWCDYDVKQHYKFICEGLIDNKNK